MIEFGHGTHVGLRRPHNEDTYCAEPELGLWLVADGMGGHELGEVASALARDTVAQFVNEGQGLKEAITQADRHIIHHSQARGQSVPMGTTVVAVKINGNDYEGAWVGDSRIYRWNGNLITHTCKSSSNKGPSVLSRQEPIPIGTSLPKPSASPSLKASRLKPCQVR